ncbi:MAG: DUF1501 domain-containing protein [Cyclobacteriaceae bacterium]
MKRRSFLRHLSHSLAVPGVVGSMGFKMPDHSLEKLLRMASDDGKVLVMIYLDGGNDGLNTVVPLDQLSALNKVRPHVILPEDKLIKLSDAEIGLHPAMSGLKSLYDEDRFQIIQNVGYAQQNYSHFRSTDIWMSASDSDQLVNTGWGGRMLNDRYAGFPDNYPSEEMPDPLAVEIGFGNSLIFQGPQSAMGMVINDPDFFYQLVNNEEQEAPETPAGDKLKFLRLIARQSQQYGQVVKAAAERVTSQANYPQTFIAQQLKIVSQLIAGGLQTPLYLVRLGGFDTHDAQVEASDHTTGEHATLLTELNDAIMAFMSDLEKQGTDDRVTGMTFSEFGRRIVSNASLGTDHGSAAPMFVFGNAVRGGVTGSNPQISSNSDYDDNLPWEYDFRQIYASVISQWLGADQTQLDNSLLKNFEQIDIIGVRQKQLSVRSEEHGLIVFPNPVSDLAHIRVNPTTEPVSIEVLNLEGKSIRSIYHGSILSNKDISWDASTLPPGRYFVIVRGQSTRRVFSISKR